MPPYSSVPEAGTAFVPVAADRLELGEGARLLQDGRIVLVDILTGRLLSLPDTPGAALRVLARLEEPLGAVAPIGADGGFLAAAGTGFARLAPDGTVLARRRLAGLDGPPPQRMNDAVCDAQGRVWAGSMAYDATPGAGVLHRLDPDGTVTTVLRDLTVPNGPAFSPDGATLYLADSAEGTVYAHRVDPATGGLSERNVLFRLPAGGGSPDGMTVDAEGRLWSAVWGAGQVRCYSPDGILLLTLDLPARQPTSVCLTGSHLLVTTARYGLGVPGPLDGAVLSTPCAVAPLATATVPPERHTC
ncbi:SMP-30/gluconolactonase/LRE family protein [Streptomyces sp. YIM B13518]|uniref:SMP-30/gluconolactonase/LRE family protein n=1 Tax=Streptomyces sp. YIM B13518 TaxID=3366316 RepID=UPI0036B4F074